MASSQLADLYIDVTARGLQAAMSGISDLQKRIAEAADAGKMLQTGLDDAGMSLKQINKAAQEFGGGLVKGAAAIAAPLAAATATITGFAHAGLQGTLQAERLSRAYTEFTRQIAGALLPVIDAMASGLETVNRWLRQAGVTGQQVFLVITVGIVAATVAATVFLAVVGAIAAAVTVATAGLNVLIGALIGLQLAIDAAVLAGSWGAMAGLLSMFEESRTAVMYLVAAFGQLWQASQPLLQAALQIAAGFAKAFVINPLVEFINGLTLLVLVAEKLVKAFLRIGQVVVALAAIQAIAPGIGQGKMKEVTLNQTGTEDAQGTFARIQEAVLKVGLGDKTEDAVVAKLKDIEGKIEALVSSVEEYVGRGKNLMGAPGLLAEGAKKIGFGGNVPGGVMDIINAINING